MRIIFGVLSLLIVVAIVGSLAKRQLQAVQVPVDGAASQVTLTGTPAQQSQQLQKKVADDIGKALQQGAQRTEDASTK